MIYFLDPSLLLYESCFFIKTNVLLSQFIIHHLLSGRGGGVVFVLTSISLLISLFSLPFLTCSPKKLGGGATPLIIQYYKNSKKWGGGAAPGATCLQLKTCLVVHAGMMV